ncbi:MAG: hypothetical protein CME62_14010 [Halobacteriovoraceae bacterium]|nr:hypothetical protein [Halobacteriovoraceae bacterium]|tara:strand:+ start:7267 stop:8037 length:771 start_codon:yes stop_codon:yes gene_type:complete
MKIFILTSLIVSNITLAKDVDLNFAINSFNKLKEVGDIVYDNCLQEKNELVPSDFSGPSPAGQTRSYGPMDALDDINSGSLEFIGRGLFNGMGSVFSSGPGIRTCVYKNERAYILYRGCMGNKSEAPNLDLTVINYDGDITRFYAETPHGFNGSLSQSDISVYESAWSITSKKVSPVSENLGMEEMNTYMHGVNNNWDLPSCTISGPAGQEGFAGCMNNYPNENSVMSRIRNFRNDPPEMWQETLQSLRQRVLSSY